MENRIIISGFGGQGVLSAGMILCYGAMFAGKYPTFFPSYGAEQRGGTSNCTVIIDDYEVASPVTQSPNIVVCFNQPSVIKFESWVEKGGLLLYNSSLVNVPPTRSDIEIYHIDANSIAFDLGDTRFVNMVMLGALMSLTHIYKFEHLLEGIDRFFSEKGKSTIVKPNQNAATFGYNYFASLTK
ncbi:MAG: 2-oxoacid:acceptor oxidoreductase family protein [Spirochaetia bacterium]|nr:2-oxoacid:acceptor oxidoreductase family protein [Spirochaetota bacterium]MCX8095881.1 2-oxoacid:acceptor oxidoreductase family protein [Spirochaetota bacterium]MDW8112592.1 2-oxoacid:acceptor oxidoreductase family protein [Spirochaetia bacterium]